MPLMYLDVALRGLELPRHVVIDVGIEADRDLASCRRRLDLRIRSFLTGSELGFHCLRQLYLRVFTKQMVL